MNTTSVPRYTPGTDQHKVRRINRWTDRRSPENLSINAGDIKPYTAFLFKTPLYCSTAQLYRDRTRSRFISWFYLLTWTWTFHIPWSWLIDVPTWPLVTTDNSKIATLTLASSSVSIRYLHRPLCCVCWQKIVTIWRYMSTLVEICRHGKKPSHVFTSS